MRSDATSWRGYAKPDVACNSTPRGGWSRLMATRAIWSARQPTRLSGCVMKFQPCAGAQATSQQQSPQGVQRPARAHAPQPSSKGPAVDIPKPDASGTRMYGRHVNVKEDQSRCAVQVRGRERWPSLSQCSRPRGRACSMACNQRSA